MNFKDKKGKLKMKTKLIAIALLASAALIAPLHAGGANHSGGGGNFAGGGGRAAARGGGPSFGAMPGRFGGGPAFRSMPRRFCSREKRARAIRGRFGNWRLQIMPCDRSVAALPTWCALCISLAGDWSSRAEGRKVIN